MHQNLCPRKLSWKTTYLNCQKHDVDPGARIACFDCKEILPVQAVLSSAETDEM